MVLFQDDRHQRCGGTNDGKERGGPSFSPSNVQRGSDALRQRVHQFFTFVRFFFRYAMVVREVLVGLLVTICAGGVAVSYAEQRPIAESIYFAFITGLTIGYGDIAPQTPWGRLISVLIGVVGMISIGLVVAVATRALADTIKQFHGER